MAKPYYDRILGRLRDDYGTSSPSPGYDAPFFQTFSMVDNPVRPTWPVIEVGDSTPINPDFSWTTIYPANVTPNTLNINDVTNSAVIGANLADTSPYTSVYGAVTRVTAGNNLYRIDGQNTLGGLFYKVFQVQWQWMTHYGEDAAAGPLIAAQILTLRVPVLKAAFAGVYTFLGGGYKYLAYPAVLGTATTFTDQSTGFPVAMLAPYVVLAVTNPFGVATGYRVHRTYNAMGGALNIVVS